MKDDKIINTNINYGSIKLLLKEKMIEKGISVEELSNKIGIKYEIINDYYNNRSNIIDSNILSKICYILDCTVKDIMEYNIK